MRTNYIAYNRVSTEQGKSGLGLEARQAATQTFISSAASGKHLASSTEVESGKRADRPELQKALEHARLIEGDVQEIESIINDVNAPRAIGSRLCLSEAWQSRRVNAARDKPSAHSGSPTRTNRKSSMSAERLSIRRPSAKIERWRQTLKNRILL